MAVEEKNWSLCSKTEGLTFAVSTVLCGQSITTLTAISVDRLLALQLRLRYRQVVTLPRVRLSVTISWVELRSCFHLLLEQTSFPFRGLWVGFHMFNYFILLLL